MDDACSICQRSFEHGQRVCRLSCRHVFHADCWESQQRHDITEANSGSSRYGPRQQFECPNCRGAGTVIAIWHYIDESRVTQQVEGQRAENLLERGTIRFNLTDSDICTTPASSPREAEATAPTFQGASSSSFYTHDHFHIHTQLPDGRPSILVDPGSVGNLCGDKWARSVAKAAHQNGMKPTYEKRETHPSK